MKERKDASVRAMELLFYRSRTEAELRKKLLEREYSEEETDAAIEYVKSYGYLNDRTYAEQYVLSNRGAKGPAAIRRELRKKGVADETADEVLSGLPEDDTGPVAALIEKRAGAPHRMDEKEYRRIFAFLARRGFSGSVIHKAMREYSESGEGPEYPEDP